MKEKETETRRIAWPMKTIVAAVTTAIVYLKWRGVLSFLAGVVLAVPVGNWGGALLAHTPLPEQPPLVLMYLLGGIFVSWLTFLLLPPRTGLGIVKKD